ncbi:uncharacterized protein [Antedon mediterranea]|uniref:uncharacterized protein isoform X2 n=1 Tax=Antedon mediterranea TaxID=105859 RepID=UPI003AF8D69B
MLSTMFCVFIQVINICLFTHASRPTCDQGWSLIDGQCFKSITSRYNYYESYKMCLREGGTLAGINDVRANAVSNIIPNNAWIGYRKETTTAGGLAVKTYVWYSDPGGKPLEFVDGDLGLDCVLFLKADLLMESKDCSYIAYGICQITLPETPTPHVITTQLDITSMWTTTTEEDEVDTEEDAMTTEEHTTTNDVGTTKDTMLTTATEEDAVVGECINHTTTSDPTTPADDVVTSQDTTSVLTTTEDAMTTEHTTTHVKTQDKTSTIADGPKTFATGPYAIRSTSIGICVQGLPQSTFVVPSHIHCVKICKHHSVNTVQGCSSVNIYPRDGQKWICSLFDDTPTSTKVHSGCYHYKLSTLGVLPL